ncbi:hypothetical protein EAH80_11380 [Mycobacterium hodleri]|uniref:Uncharacterized protein n=2 Tax=Mycolicibacterium hodleri TaxID=49897 RepID=A0A502EB49_9MYCO|nr:hypothetical protein EAH80_11380 [Mycolicibacterium hodleri]
MPKNPFSIDPADELRAALRGLGLDRLQADRYIATMLDWLNGETSPRSLLAEMRRHALENRSAPTPFDPFPAFPPRGHAIAFAQAVLDARDALGGTFADVLEVAAVAEVDAVGLAALINVGRGISAEQASGPVVGVLLPMRLETRFFEPANGAGWVLKVRIVPDAASLNRHEPVPTPGELDAVEAMWTFSGGDLTSPAGQTEWRRLVAGVGAGRAAWLARTFPAVDVDGVIGILRPDDVRTDLGRSRVGGLPDTLELWMARSGGAPELAASLTVDQDRLGLDFPDPDSGETRWWTSFAEALEVGLAAELDLGQVRPNDIDVLYVVGLGDGDPATLFTDHRDAGILGVLPLGTPTNSVAGEPAADLARDPETWRLLVTDPPVQPGTEAVSLALTGTLAGISLLPGGEVDDRPVNQALVAALWPALWGHSLKDVWGLSDDAFAIGLWAIDNLVPEGPVPPVRVGDQPYGILPVTSLGRWQPEPDDPPVEARLATMTGELRAAWAGAAEGAGTSVGADTDRLLDLLGRVPNSRGYAWRWFLPLELLHMLSWAFGDGIQFAVLREWWDKTADPLLAVTGQPPVRRYGTLGYPQDLAIPLVVPDNLPPNLGFEELIARLVSVPPNIFAGARGKELFNPLPNSLLVRLLMHSLLLSAAEVARRAYGQQGPLLEPIEAPVSQQTEIGRWGQQYSDNLLDGDPPSRLYEVGRDAVKFLSSVPPDTLERVFRSTLDTASHRIDPWITGLAWRRLQSLSASNPAPRFSLGAYGWVDAPRPRSVLGPPDEFFHAPSQEQALTTAILRDRSLYDAEANRWHMNLDSDAIRLADQLASEVRIGAPIVEVLGRAVERAVATRASVESLRRQFPIRTEHAGRRVCDGQAVLARYLSNPASLVLTSAQLAALAPLARAVDTYADLLIADGVFDVVSGRTALAGAAMEAAAGLSAPPSLDVIGTQRGGRSATSTVVMALPAGVAPTVLDAHTSPGAVAEPAAAALIVSLTGAATSAAWTWTVLDEDGNAVGTVRLSDLGLQPIDTLSLSGDDLAAFVLARLPGDDVEMRVLPAHREARRLSDILGNQPATPAHLTVDGTAPADAPVQADLAARYAAVHSVAILLQAELLTAGTATEPVQRAALLTAAKWGITPLTVDDAPIATIVARALAALGERLDTAPSPAAAAALSVAALARAMAELVSPEGRIPILSRLRLDRLPTPLSAEPPQAGVALEPDWLEVVATVRPTLARLEAHQLGQRLDGAAELSSWSSRLGDPWQLDTGPLLPSGLAPATYMLAVFGPDGTLTPGAHPSRLVAFGLLDQWTEVVPATDQTTAAAFHFDAPGARAPQAILVAVPPDVNTPLDTETLVDIVAETRQSARARAASPEELDAYAGGEPLTLFPADGPTAVRLEPA